jgi:hypothetical protein
MSLQVSLKEGGRGRFDYRRGLAYDKTEQRPQAKGLLGTGTSKKTDSPLESPEWTDLVDILILTLSDSGLDF